MTAVVQYLASPIKISIYLYKIALKAVALLILGFIYVHKLFLHVFGYILIVEDMSEDIYDRYSPFGSVSNTCNVMVIITS